MVFKFTPADMGHDIQVPTFEKARADFAPYYALRPTTTESKLQGEIATEMGKLGGYISIFEKGDFEWHGRKRHGYRVYFTLKGAPGIISVAGLPIEKETPEKISRVMRQALANVRDWLKSAVTAQVFSPGTNPLMPHLLLPDGSMTIADYIAVQNEIPLLTTVPEQEIIIETES